MDDRSLQECTWKDVRLAVKKVNKRLFDIIEKISPDDSYTLFVAKYGYGDYILNQGELFLPDSKGKVVSIFDSRVAADIKQKLGYLKGTNPLTLVLKNNSELFIPTENRIISYGLLEPGSMLGIWPVLQPAMQNKLIFTPFVLWNMTAGARSIFALPKITDVNGFTRVRKYRDISNESPRSLQDHWFVLKNFYQTEDKYNWISELLFFSKKWADNINDPAFGELNSYLTTIGWEGSEYWRNQFCWDLVLSRVQSNRDIKPCPYIADLASHLLSLSIGVIPSFRPLLNDDSAPVQLFQRIFEDEYNIRYAPIIIGPVNFSILNAKSSEFPVYYSFHYNTSIKLSKKSSQRSSMITDMYNIRSLLNKYLEDIRKDKSLNINGTIWHELVAHAKFSFCHHITDDGNRMNSANAIAQEDPAFVSALEQCKTKEFVKNAPFLNGCVQISRGDLT